ncbi:twin-arginine translocation signal domain-containing protein, partial [bacterium]
MEQTPLEKTPAVNLDRRTFLQTAALAAGAVTVGGAVLSSAKSAMAQDASYPAFPKLAEKPLKPSTLGTTGISRKTHEEHFKLYQGYVNKLNEIETALQSSDPKGGNYSY